MPSHFILFFNLKLFIKIHSVNFMPHYWVLITVWEKKKRHLLKMKILVLPSPQNVHLIVLGMGIRTLGDSDLSK